MSSPQGCPAAPRSTIRSWCIWLTLGPLTGLGMIAPAAAGPLTGPQDSGPITTENPVQDTRIEGWASEDDAPQEDRKEIRSNVLGCRLLLPKESRATHTSLGDGSVLRILDSEEQPPRWATTIRILKQPPPQNGTFGATTTPTPATLLAAFVADSKRVNPEMTFVKEVPDSTVAGLP